MTEIEIYESRIGETSVRALQKGGESLLSVVEDALGVAYRHCQRVRDDGLPITDGLRNEIEGAFDRAERLIEGP